MCLISNSKEPLIAKEDIVCYKILKQTHDMRYVSPYRDFQYKINDFNYPLEENDLENLRKVISVNEIKTRYSYAYRIGQGFLHCLVSEEVPSFILSVLTDGFLGKSLSLYLFECYIPKGSKYFLNKNDTEICANKLFVKDVKFKID